MPTSASSPVSLSLQGFLQAAAPDSMARLPRPWQRMPDSVRNTNVEYLLRIAMEAREILHEGDSLVKTFQFDVGVLECYWQAVDALYRFFKDGVLPTPVGHTAIQDIPAHLERIVRYYFDKSDACDVEYKRVSNHWHFMRTQFVDACQRGDYRKLAEVFYPYIDGILEIEPDDVLPECLQGKIELPEEWSVRQRTLRIAAMFQNATSVVPARVVHHLGQPETGVPDMSMTILLDSKRRNLTVGEDMRQFIKRMQDILRENAPKQGPDSPSCNPA